ncbi:transposon Ty3-I Gag-Pol polyprotein [Trichonephila clavipes]|nr:transposon Ty3-I Gag-Pol polyprotein [Trichonephila clavipes]
MGRQRTFTREKVIPQSMYVAYAELFCPDCIATISETSRVPTEISQTKQSFEFLQIVSPDLDANLKRMLVDVLQEYSKAFKERKNGTLQITVKPRINTGDNLPVKQRAHRVSPAERRIIPDETFDDHLQYLRSVLKCLQDAGLVLNPKCEFGRRQIKILGHLVSEEGFLSEGSIYVSRLITRAEESRQLAKIGTLKAQHRGKTRYDARHRSVSYRTGELVRVFKPVMKVGLSEKLLKRYLGPYRVARKLSDVTHEVEELEPSP